MCQTQSIIFTARKRSLGQGNIFAPVCHSVYRGGPWSWGWSGGAWSRGAWSWGCLVSEGVPGPGVCGPGYVWSRGCLVETSPRDGHCCGQYTSYWNAFLFLLFLHIYLYISNISHTEVIFDISDIETSMYFDAIYNNYKCEIPQILFNYFQSDRHEVFSFCQAFDPNVNLNVICVKPYICGFDCEIMYFTT